MRATFITSISRPKAGWTATSGVALSSTLFAGLPLIVAATGTQFDVGPGYASAVPSALLLGAMLGNAAASRIRASAIATFVAASVWTMMAFFASAATVDPAVFVATNAAVGLGLGLLSGMSWSLAFVDKAQIASLSKADPLTTLLAAPLTALIISGTGLRQHYLGLGLLAGAVALVAMTDRPKAPARTQGCSSSSGRSLVLPAAILFLHSVGGSALLVNSFVIGQANTGVSRQWFAWALAGNAIAGVVATRRVRGPSAVLWFFLPAALAPVVATTGSAALLGAAIVVWGFAWWTALPSLFAIVASASGAPRQSAPALQVSLSAGRVVGPLLGGTVLGATSPGVVGALSLILILVASLAATFLVARQAGRSKLW